MKGSPNGRAWHRNRINIDEVLICLHSSSVQLFFTEIVGKGSGCVVFNGEDKSPVDLSFGYLSSKDRWGEGPRALSSRGRAAGD
jgi:hypothetical protein